ncbi:MAG: hypothetical protein LBK65_04360 [Tannerellaceae bacterium]|jgi:hypothetical protein|nr:hypothetical protein [Tannerellaceae bacterium]
MKPYYSCLIICFILLAAAFGGCKDNDQPPYEGIETTPPPPPPPPVYVEDSAGYMAKASIEGEWKLIKESIRIYLHKKGDDYEIKTPYDSIVSYEDSLIVYKFTVEEQTYTYNNRNDLYALSQKGELIITRGAGDTAEERIPYIFFFENYCDPLALYHDPEPNLILNDSAFYCKLYPPKMHIQPVSIDPESGLRRYSDESKTLISKDRE